MAATNDARRAEVATAWAEYLVKHEPHPSDMTVSRKAFFEGWKVAAEWAAARAETTTATDEDTTTRLAAAEAELDRLCDGGRFIMSIPAREGYDSDLLIPAALSDLRGLLATARTVRVHPTYTVEYQQKIADELGVEREGVLRALGLAAPLLATARTRPSREQIAQVLADTEPDVAPGYYEAQADAVLALLEGGDDR